jgi:ribosome-binding protein aMBF1 (putative translation factor)
VDKNKFNKKFGKFIAQKRIEVGITQSELAARMDNNPQNISRLERGEISPTLFWVYNLSKALNIKLVDLLKEFD